MSSQAPLRVAVVARSVYPLHGYGGLERHVYDLVRSLLRRELRVILIAPPASNRVSSAVAVTEDLAPEAAGRFSVVSVPYRTFPFAGRRGTTVIDRSTAYPLFGLRAGRVAGTLAEQGAVDIVHGLGASVLGYARLRASAPDRTPPLVFNPQGLEEFGATDRRRSRLKQLGYGPLQWAVRACARAADRVIATDQALVPTVMAHLHPPPDRVRVVPNGIDLEACDRLAGPEEGHKLRAGIGLGPRDVLFLSVGRVERNKGFEILVRALAALDHAGAGQNEADRVGSARWRWALVGDGPYRGRLERAIRESGLRARVLLPGRVGTAELHAWYEAATVFVHPTLYEGSSLVTLEAMAHRRAVVATDAGGIPDKVIPGTNGWLVRAGDATAIATALREALECVDRLPIMGAAGRAIVEQSFSLDVVTDALLGVYAELVDRS